MAIATPPAAPLTAARPTKRVSTLRLASIQTSWHASIRRQQPATEGTTRQRRHNSRTALSRKQRSGVVRSPRTGAGPAHLLPRRLVTLLQRAVGLVTDSSLRA